MPLKVMTVLGTRPEIIRLSRVIARLDEEVDHRLVHTGQNYDPLLTEVFFDDLELRAPDYRLNVDTSSLARVFAGTLTATEDVLRREQPDAVLVLGDTNSSISAVIAKRMKIPVYHMEAGNRSFDENVPEEVNRRIVDHVADFNLVYTEHARRNLLAEGLHPRRIYLTGSPLREVLSHFAPAIERSTILERLEVSPGQYFLVSMHREENVDNDHHLGVLLAALRALREEYHLPVVVSTHPRTRKRLDAMAGFDPDDGINFLEPFGYFDYNHLQRHAFCVVSDSGTISEEASILGFPAVTIRNAMERPEAMDAGAIAITGIDVATIGDAIRSITRRRARGWIPEVPADYRIEDCSQRVINVILGTAKLSRRWSNLDAPGA